MSKKIPSHRTIVEALLNSMSVEEVRQYYLLHNTEIAEKCLEALAAIEAELKAKEAQEKARRPMAVQSSGAPSTRMPNRMV